MIATSTIINSAAAAIAADSTIAAYITANFPGSTLKVYVGFDPSDPPGENEAPYVVLTHGPASYDVGDYANERRPNFSLVWVIKKTTATTAGNIITKDGLALVDGLGQLIRATLQTTFGHDHFAMADYDLDSEHPLWVGGMDVTLVYQAGTDYEPTTD